MPRLPVTLACWDYDRTRGLADGSIRPDGVALNYISLPVEEIFYRMARFGEFDAAEMSMSSYCVTLMRDDPPFIAVPVFPSRFFRHSSIYVNTSAGIERPQDLVGKRVGVPEYQMTAPVWIRGILADEYGVAPDSVSYHSGGEEEPGRVEKLKLDLPPNISLTPIGPDQTLARMLADGALDAFYTARAPSTFYSEPDRVRRLFPDYVPVERDYFRRTRIFPIMHVVAIRRELYRANRWLAQSLLKAFVASQRLTYEGLMVTAALKTMLPWQVARGRGCAARDGRGLVELRLRAEPARARHLPALPPRAGAFEPASLARGAVRAGNAGELPDLSAPPAPAGSSVRAGIELGPAALHHGTVAGIGRAGIEHGGGAEAVRDPGVVVGLRPDPGVVVGLRPGRIRRRGIAAAGEDGHDRLQGHRRHLLEKLAQMGAALGAADPLGRAPEEAPPDPEAREAGEGGGADRADRIGGEIGRRFGGDDLHGLVHGKAHFHAVELLARLDPAAILVAEPVCLGIGERGLDVEQPVLALESTQHDVALVHEAAFGGGG